MDKKVEELLAKAEKDEKDREKIEKAAERKLADIIGETDKVRYVYVSELDCKLAYKALTVQALEQLQTSGKANRITEILYQMLHAADESVTREQAERLPANVALKIVNVSGFLSME